MFKVKGYAERRVPGQVFTFLHAIARFASTTKSPKMLMESLEQRILFSGSFHLVPSNEVAAPSDIVEAIETTIDAGASAISSSVNIEVVSRGFSFDRNGGGSFFRNGELVYETFSGMHCDPSSSFTCGRGFNIVVFDPSSGGVEATASFDTFGHDRATGPVPSGITDGEIAAHQMMEFLDSLRDGVIIAIAAGDDAGLNKDNSCDPWSRPHVGALRQTLESLGSQHVNQICYQDPWAMIAIKGQGMVAESINNTETPPDNDDTTTSVTADVVVNSVAQVIDNGDDGFAVEGQWTAFLGQGFLDDLHHSATGHGSDKATWTFTDLAPGQYRISTTWSAHPNRATNVPYTIFDGSAKLTTIRINQEQAPSVHVVVNGVNFHDLGTFDIANSVMAVQISDDADQYVIADAVRIERVGNLNPSVQVIDNGGNGFAVEGQWTAFLGQGFLDDLHHSATGHGSDKATWTFTDLAPGQYRISTTWSAHPNRATNVPYTIFDGSAKLTTIRINQEQVPSVHVVVNGVNFHDLGTFDIANSVMAVQISDDADQYVIADAIRIERIAGITQVS